MDMQTDTTGPAGLAELLRLRGPAPAPAAGEVSIDGHDPFFRSPIRIGEGVAAVLAAVGVAANDLWEIRTGRRQRVEVSVPHAAATLRTGDYTRRRDEAGAWHGIPIPAAMAHMLTVTQPWPTRDGRWFLPHLNLPHLAARVLGVLRCENTPGAVRAAVGQWDAEPLEEAIAAARACGGVVRTSAEWLAHPQGAYLAARPVVEVERIGDAPVPPRPEPTGAGDRPLSGLRVLDLTRILAGPIGGRTLAEHGADVLMITAEGLPQTPEHVRDTSHGKRSCYLDLKQPDGAARFAELVRTADVVIDGYRPGQLAKLGFSQAELVRLRPGLVHVDVSCFGSGGPFADRAGWEQVAQSVSGLCEIQGRLTGAGQPKLLSAPACDYTTGYITGYGALLALGRRAREGGSWAVRASLCQSAMFLQRQGLAERFDDAPEQLSEPELAARHVEADTSYGRLRTLGPALRMSETPPHWARTTPRLGGDAPEWLPR